MKTNLSIGNRIRKLRTEAGLTQKDLAKKLKVSQTTVSNLEAGSFKDYKSKTLIKIAKLSKNPRHNVMWLLAGLQ